MRRNVVDRTSSGSYDASVSKRVKIRLIAACTVAFLLGLHPKQVLAADAPASDAGVEHLKQVLVSWTWSWVHPLPNKWTEVHFNQDGSLTGWVGSHLTDTRYWKATGPHTVQMTGPEGDDRLREITFDDALTNFVCQAPDGKGSGKTFHITGKRLASVAKSAPAAMAPAPAAPGPGSATAAVIDPQEAGHHIGLHVEAVKSGSVNQVTRSSAVHMTDTAIHRTMSANTAVGLQQASNQSEALTITLHNLGPQVEAARVEWFFVAGPIKPDWRKPISEQEYIFDKGALDVSLQGSATQVVPAESSAVTSVTKRSASSTMGGGRGMRQMSARAPELTGEVFRGWLVRLIAGKKVLAVSGSKQAYEDLAGDLGKLPIP